MTRTCVDLFAGVGGFSAAFDDAEDWRVFTVDHEATFEPDLRADVLEVRPGDLPYADLVVASPPCTTFSQANQAQGHFVDGKPATEAAREATALTFHAVGLIHALAPEWWLVENPVGFMRRLLGSPAATVTWCQYGAEVQKPTDLWGSLPAGLDLRSCAAGEPCHASNPDGGGTTPSTSPYADERAERARVPRGFSDELLRAIRGGAGQAPLPGVVDGRGSA